MRLDSINISDDKPVSCCGGVAINVGANTVARLNSVILFDPCCDATLKSIKIRINE